MKRKKRRNPLRTRSRSLRLESLENRLLLTIDIPNPLAVDDGRIPTEAAERELTLTIVNEPAKPAAIGVLATPLGDSTLDLSQLQVTNEAGTTTIAPTYTNGDYGPNSIWVGILPLQDFNEFTITVGGDNGSTGEYEVKVFLVGDTDVNGSRGVSAHELSRATAAAVQAAGTANVVTEEFYLSQGIDLGEDQYRPQFDTNINGKVDAADLDLIDTNTSFNSITFVELIGDNEAPDITGNVDEDTGSSATDGITTDATPDVTGTIVDDSTITDFSGRVDNSDVAGFTDLKSLIQSDGSFTIPFSQLTQLADGADLADGNQHTLFLYAKDELGQERGGADQLGLFELTFQVDTDNPAAPTAPDLVIADDTGTSNSDNITAKTVLTFSVSGDSETEIRLFSDLVDNGATVIGSGLMNGAPINITANELAPGDHQITAVALDVAGNQSDASTATSITIDVSPPVVPSFDLNPTADRADPNGNPLTSETTVAIQGTTESGASVHANGLPDTADGNGQFDVANLALDYGENTITVSAEDIAGNVSTASRVFSQNDPPVAGDPLSSNNLNGDSETFDLSTLFSDSNIGDGDSLSYAVVGNNRPELVTSAVVSGDTLTNSYEDGSGLITLDIQATDLLGDTAIGNINIALRDGLPPDVTLTANPDSGVAGDLVTNALTSFTGTLTDDNEIASCSYGLENTDVTNFVDCNLDQDGKFTFPLSTLETLAGGTLADNGAHQLRFLTADILGNTTTTPVPFSFTIDTQSPGKPATPDLKDADDSGTSNTDDITNVTTPTFSASGESGATLKLFSDQVGASPIGMGTMNGAPIDIISSTLGAGGHEITLTATDLAGNESAPSDPLSITIDDVAPASVTFELDPSGTTTSETNVTLQGTTEPGAHITNDLNSNEATADGGGLFTFDATLAFGSNTILVTAADTAGNETAASNTIIRNTNPTTTPRTIQLDEDARTGETITLTDESFFDDADLGTTTDFLTYTIIQNDNPSLVSTDLDDDQLTLGYTADGNGTAIIEIEAKDSLGATVNGTLTITIDAVDDPPTVVDPNNPKEFLLDDATFATDVTGASRSVDNNAVAPQLFLTTFPLTGIFDDPDGDANALTISIGGANGVNRELIPATYEDANQQTIDNPRIVNNMLEVVAFEYVSNAVRDASTLQLAASDGGTPVSTDVIINVVPLQTMEVHLVLLDTATASELESGTDTLPDSLTQLIAGQNFVAEIWLKDNLTVSSTGGAASDGITGGAFDVKFNDTLVELIDVDHGSLFVNNPTPTTLDGITDTIPGFGGGQNPPPPFEGVGEFVRLGFINFKANQPNGSSDATFDIKHLVGVESVTRQSVADPVADARVAGTVHETQIDFSNSSLTVPVKAPVDFTVTGSTITTSGTYTPSGGSASALQPQGTGSDSTDITGTLSVLLDDTANPSSIQILGSNLQLATSGDWKPLEDGAGDANATAPADLGYTVPVNSNTVNIAVREVIAAVVSNAASTLTNGEFPGTDLSWTTTGRADSHLVVPGAGIFERRGTDFTDGELVADQNLANGTLAEAGGTFQLDLPLNHQVTLNVGSDVVVINVLGTVTGTFNSGNGEGEALQAVSVLTPILDVNRDGHISPGDALAVINGLNNPAALTAGADVNLDGRSTPVDALLIINELNRTSEFDAEGEGRHSAFADPFNVAETSVNVAETSGEIGPRLPASPFGDHASSRGESAVEVLPAFQLTEDDTPEQLAEIAVWIQPGKQEASEPAEEESAPWSELVDEYLAGWTLE